MRTLTWLASALTLLSTGLAHAADGHGPSISELEPAAGVCTWWRANAADATRVRIATFPGDCALTISWRRDGRAALVHGTRLWLVALPAGAVRELPLPPGDVTLVGFGPDDVPYAIADDPDESTHGPPMERAYAFRHRRWVLTQKRPETIDPCNGGWAEHSVSVAAQLSASTADDHPGMKRITSAARLQELDRLEPGDPDFGSSWYEGGRVVVHMRDAVDCDREWQDFEGVFFRKDSGELQRFAFPFTPQKVTAAGDFAVVSDSQRSWLYDARSGGLLSQLPGNEAIIWPE